MTITRATALVPPKEVARNRGRHFGWFHAYRIDELPPLRFWLPAALWWLFLRALCKTSGSNSTAGLLEFTGAFTAVTFTLVLKSSVKTFSSSCNAAFTASVLLFTAWSAGIFSISILERCNLTCWIPITTITHYGPSKSGVPTACFSRTPLKSTRHGSFRRLRSRSWWLISFPDGLPKRGV